MDPMSLDDQSLRQRMLDAAVTGAELDLSHAADRTLPAADLRAVLLNRDASLVAVSIRGATITGPLNLDQAHLPLASFFGCTFEDWISLEDASGRALTWDDCDLAGLRAATIALEGSLRLTRSRVSENVDLTGARIGGRLNLEDTTITATTAFPGLDADDLLVVGTLDAGGLAVQEIVLSSASIGGHLRLEGATLTSDTLSALWAPGLVVKGMVDLRPWRGQRFSARGKVWLADASIGSSLWLDGASFHHDDGSALNGDSMTVGGKISGVPAGELRLESYGRLRFMDAKAREASFSGALLRANESFPEALDLGGMEVAGDLKCSLAGTVPFEADGTVDLTQATVGGQLVFTGAELTGRKGIALAAGSITVRGGAFLSADGARRFTTDGQVILIGATFALSVELNGARLNHPGEVAFAGDRMKVAGNAFFQQDESGPAFEAIGDIRMGGCRVDGQLGFDRASVKGVVDLSECTVKSLWLRYAEPVPRTVLINGEVGALNVWDPQRQAIVPPALLLGLRYEALDSIGAPDVEAHLAWLERIASGYRPQPYEQLAQVYAAHGHEDEAKAVQIAKQRRRRRATPWYRRASSYVLGATVAHGYRSWQAALWLIALLAIGTGLFGLVFADSLKDPHAELTPARDAVVVPAFQPFIYTLDVLLPVIDLGQATAWNAHGAAQWVAVALALSGWLLTAALVAGIAARRR